MTVPSAEQIVRALAAADPNHLTSTTGTLRRCTFCRVSNDWPRTLVFATDHEPDCPWRQAVEWTDAQDADACGDPPRPGDPPPAPWQPIDGDEEAAANLKRNLRGQ